MHLLVFICVYLYYFCVIVRTVCVYLCVCIISIYFCVCILFVFSCVYLYSFMCICVYLYYFCVLVSLFIICVCSYLFVCLCIICVYFYYFCVFLCVSSCVFLCTFVSLCSLFVCVVCVLPGAPECRAPAPCAGRPRGRIREQNCAAAARSSDPNCPRSPARAVFAGHVSLQVFSPSR